MLAQGGDELVGAGEAGKVAALDRDKRLGGRAQIFEIGLCIVWSNRPRNS
jgi:hypothetical protein